MFPTTFNFHVSIAFNRRFPRAFDHNKNVRQRNISLPTFAHFQVDITVKIQIETKLTHEIMDAPEYMHTPFFASIIAGLDCVLASVKQNTKIVAEMLLCYCMRVKCAERKLYGICQCT